MINNQLTNQNPNNNLVQTVTSLTDSLNLVKPNNSQEVQIITYALVATAIVGLFVYHYIKNNQDANN